MKVVKLLQSLPQPAYDPKQVQQNEAKIAAELGISLYALMEKAGAAVFTQIQLNYPELSSLLVISGKGNNGGDGFIVARLAAQVGIKVMVLIVAEKTEIKGDALTALDLLTNMSAILRYVDKDETSLKFSAEFIVNFQGELIVDSLFGTGFKGQLSPQFLKIIEAINSHVAAVLAVDIPSGLNANTGNDGGIAVIAQQTITFIACKKGLLTAQAANYVGELYLADLDIGESFIQKISSSVFIQGQKNLPILAKRKASSHKGNIGLVLAIGGNKGMPGAIRLSAEAALRSGASLVAAACHQQSQALVFADRPEIMLVPAVADNLKIDSAFQKAKVIIIGPGLGRDLWAQQLFSAALSSNEVSNETSNKTSNKLLVIDADALSLLSEQPIKRNNWVLTPHPGEAASLLGCSIADIENDRFNAVNAIVDKYGGICILKGAGSLISDGKSTWINTSGNAGMASGGMGDVLSGIIAALLIQLPEPLVAVRYAVYIHGLAADIVAKRQGQRGILASDLFPEIQRLVNTDS
ncbi:MAG: NAD(P)H-hydrate dehydratase [Colwellia sp.]|nr:NAD(P)H-hydrate dehydratase [Colwellia sp.]